MNVCTLRGAKSKLVQVDDLAHVPYVGLARIPEIETMLQIIFVFTWLIKLTYFFTSPPLT